MRITISGPPGSGKSTVCRSLANELSMDSVIFGQLFRDMAKERNMDLHEFSDIAEKDISIDKNIDAQIVKIASEKEDLILESRLSAQMLVRNDIPAFKVYLEANPKERAKRLCDREGGCAEDAFLSMQERAKSEAKRYKTHYDIDLYDLSIYDLVIDTTEIGPDEVVKMIIEAVRDV